MATGNKNIDILNVSYDEAATFFAPREMEHQRLLKPVLPVIMASETVFDIGANAGFFSRSIVNAGYKGEIVMFEPIPNLASIALRTLSAFTNKKIMVNAAVGESDAVIDIFLPPSRNIGWITAVAEKAGNSPSISVPVVSAEPFVRHYKPGFIKIDVEGFESFILSSIMKCLNGNYRPTFLVELGWGKGNPHWDFFLRVAADLINMDYEFHSIQSQQIPIGLAALQEMEKTQDILIIPAKKADATRAHRLLRMLMLKGQNAMRS